MGEVRLEELLRTIRQEIGDRTFWSEWEPRIRAFVASGPRVCPSCGELSDGIVVFLPGSDLLKRLGLKRGVAAMYFVCDDCQQDPRVRAAVEEQFVRDARIH